MTGISRKTMSLRSPGLYIHFYCPYGWYIPTNHTPKAYRALIRPYIPFHRPYSWYLPSDHASKDYWALTKPYTPLHCPYGWYLPSDYAPKTYRALTRPLDLRGLVWLGILAPRVMDKGVLPCWGQADFLSMI